jgi:phage terminase large subunit
MALKYPGTRWLMGRAVLKTLMVTTFKSFLEVCKLQGVIQNVHFKVNFQSHIITFKNGSEIIMMDLSYKPSDPDFTELGSLEITGAGLDEVNQMVYRAFYLVKSRIRYKLDEYGLYPTMLMGCNPSKGWVYFEFYLAQKQHKLKESLYFIQALVTDNPKISKHYIKNLQDMPPIDRERLLKGNWEYESKMAALFRFDVITDMFSNYVKESTEKFISCDAARFGRDLAVIVVWEGLKTIEWHISERCETTDIENKIEELREKHSIPRSHVVVDDSGLGGGVVDHLPGVIGFVSASSPILSEFEKKKQKYLNLRAQAYFKFSEMANDRKVLIEIKKVEYFGFNKKMIQPEEIKEMLSQELEIIEQVDFEKDKSAKVTSKDMMKAEISRSPDFMDTLMMRFYFEIKPETHNIVSGSDDLNYDYLQDYEEEDKIDFNGF